MNPMPDNWKPSVNAWQAEFANDRERVFAYFGVQTPSPAYFEPFVRTFQDASEQSISPGTASSAHYADAAGYDNMCFIAYWHRQSDFERWWSDAGFGAWGESSPRSVEPSGLWREIFAVAPARFETLFSTRNAAGVARLGEPLGYPVRDHHYRGAMRDRFAAARRDALEAKGEYTRSNSSPEPTRARISVSVPDNLCLIRSGQDLRACTPGETDDYLEMVYSVFAAGMSYLRENPEESGCLSCRFMDETDIHGRCANQSFGLVRIDVASRRRAHNHPTHRAIFESFLRMIEKRGGPLKLRLWHEVLACTGAKTNFEYLNCHSATGLLPFLPSKPATSHPVIGA